MTPFDLVFYLRFVNTASD